MVTSFLPKELLFYIRIMPNLFLCNTETSYTRNTKLGSMLCYPKIQVFGVIGRCQIQFNDYMRCNTSPITKPGFNGAPSDVYVWTTKTTISFKIYPDIDLHMCGNDMSNLCVAACSDVAPRQSAISTTSGVTGVSFLFIFFFFSFVAFSCILMLKRFLPCTKI